MPNAQTTDLGMSTTSAQVYFGLSIQEDAKVSKTSDTEKRIKLNG